MLHHKTFVREKGEPNLQTERKQNVSLSEKLKGEEVKQFYEEIISGESTAKPQVKPKSTAKPKKAKKEVAIADEKAIFQLAQTNNVDMLARLVSTGVDVNVRDAFGWTSLMCAACSGSEEAARLLLGAGADLRASDPGYNALYLAKKHRHTNIVKLLTNGLQPQSSSRSRREQTPAYYCNVCKQSSNTSKFKHDASTVHLLAVNSMKVRTFYGIPESNRGFQMLMRNGWDRESGLGPEGSGRKFPVKATQRKDRRGVGASPMTTESERRKGRTGAVPDQRYSSRLRDRAFEKHFRQQFS